MSDNKLPLYLDKRETEVLAISVEIMIRMDSAVLADSELQKIAEHQIQEREGPVGVARVDQALAAARERLPVLRGLHTALTEHGEALDRVRKGDSATGNP